MDTSEIFLNEKRDFFTEITADKDTFKTNLKFGYICKVWYCNTVISTIPLNKKIKGTVFNCIKERGKFES